MKISVIAIAALVQLATTIDAFVVPITTTTTKTAATGRNSIVKDQKNSNNNKKNLVECHATKKGRGEGYGPPLDNISEGTCVRACVVCVLVIQIATLLSYFLLVLLDGTSEKSFWSCLLLLVLLLLLLLFVVSTLHWRNLLSSSICNHTFFFGYDTITACYHE